jgi:hypothetical protein
MRRKAIIGTFIAAGLLIILLLDLPGARLAADRLKRVHELETREARLYEQLAEKDAHREAQRKIYIDRIRKGEAQLREHAQEILALRGRPEVKLTVFGSAPTPRD